VTSLAALLGDDPQRVGRCLLGSIGSEGMGQVYLVRSAGGRLGVSLAEAVEGEALR